MANQVLISLWSLSVELFLYLFFPILFPFLASRSLRFNVVSMFCIYGVTMLFLNPESGNGFSSWLKYSPYPRLGTFWVGISTGIIILRSFQKTQTKLGQKLLFYILSILVLFLLLSIGVKEHNNGWLIPVYVFFLLGFCIPSKFEALISNGFFLLLGKISYGIYILQYPVLLYFTWILSRLGYSLSLGLFVLYFLILNLIAMTCFYFLEKPLGSLIARKFIDLKIPIDDHNSVRTWMKKGAVPFLISKNK